MCPSSCNRSSSDSCLSSLGRRYVCPNYADAVLSILSFKCMYYGHKKTVTQSLLLLAGCIVVLGGFETGMVFAIRVRNISLSYRRVVCI